MLKEAEITLAPLPYTSRIDRSGKVRMSSHTALVTAATLLRYRQLKADPNTPGVNIYIAGESTFGEEFPSTSELMRQQLIKKGVAQEHISIAENLNNTQDQLQNLKEQNPNNLTVIDLRFHDRRVKRLMRRLELHGSTRNAEDILAQAYRGYGFKEGVTQERLERFVGSNVKVAGASKVYLSEAVINFGALFGSQGDRTIAAVRQITGQEGATVTDYHHVEAAQKHLEAARKLGILPSSA